MTQITFAGFTEQLQELQEEGLTFEDKAATWDTLEDVKEIIDALTENKLVHYLKLEGNTLGPKAAAAIGKALEKHPEFRKAFWRNMFTRRLKNEIPEALKSLSNGLITAKAQLTVIDLSDNALGPNGMIGLVDLLSSPVCYSLKELYLNNCGLGIGGGQMLSKAVLDCHRRSVIAGTPLCLKVFVTGRNRLENEGAKAISEIFATLKTLEHIAMPQNSIYHAGIASLTAGFKENQNLQVLNLNDNTVGAKGANLLAKAFVSTLHLREINLGDCLLSTAGAWALAEALDNNHVDLELLDLSFNEIGMDGGLAIVQALQNKPRIRKVNLHGNNFGPGRQKIIQAMQLSSNPDALEDPRDDSEGEEDVDDDEDDEDDLDEDDLDEEQMHNDTTEEVAEDEEYEDDEYADGSAEETAYTTSLPFTTTLFGGNQSVTSNKTATIIDVHFASTPKEFCLSQFPCSLQSFQSLRVENKAEAFRNIIKQFTGENYLLVLVFTALKCAHLALSSDEALMLAVEFYKECFDFANKTKQERRVLNFFLIQLGFLRTEQNFLPLYNVKSCRYALRNAMDQNKISSDTVTNTFNVFYKNFDT